VRNHKQDSSDIQAVPAVHGHEGVELISLENVKNKDPKDVIENMLSEYKRQKLNGSIELHINNGVIIKVKNIIVENI